jgi:hypothetical protein
MKNEFLKKLEKDEKLLFYGVSDVSKTSKQFGRILLLMIVLIIFWIVFILGLKEDNQNFFNVLGNITMVMVFIFLTLCLLYGFVYNVFLKYKNKGNEYFVTSKRIALYDSKNGFMIRNIFDIEHIGIVREKNNYGDITFHFRSNSVLEQLKNNFIFEGIENPRTIVKIITDINKNVHVYDDKPTIMGKKIG